MRISDWSSDVCSSDLRDITWNTLWNGVGYRDTVGKPSTTFSLKRWKQLGIPIPANLFFYQVDHARSNEFPDVYFRSEEHTSELQSLMRISYAVFCLKKKTKHYIQPIIS